MTDERRAVGKRRTAVEIEQIVAAFADGGLNRSQFCQRQGLTLGTLNRYLKKLRGEGGSGTASGRLVTVELSAAGGKRDSGCGLALVLGGGRRIEVEAGFDASALQRLVQTLERM